ncbi:MAG: hypothetical protein AB1730_26795 [Myxococcota bacterium]
MSNDFRNPKVLAALAPRDAGFYLQRMGWREAERAENASYWLLRSDHAVMVPLNRTFDDYALRLAELLDSLQKIERRPAESILADLRHSAADFLRVRVSRRDESDGTIPLSKAPRIFDGSRDLVLYAAASTIEPRPTFRKEDVPEAARLLLKEARFGQTERGSYVVNILAPLPTNFDLFAVRPNEPVADRPDLEPFARRTLRTLMTALERVRLAENEAQVVGHVAEGISAQLCKSVAHASGGDHGLRSLEISASWSPALREDEATPVVARLARSQVKVIRRAGKALSAIVPQLGARITGQVVRLARDTARTQRVVEGIITVEAVMPGRARRNVTMAVNAEFHERAIRAYREERKVTCVGDLLDRPPSPYLFNVREFEFVDD